MCYGTRRIAFARLFLVAITLASSNVFAQPLGGNIKGFFNSPTYLQLQWGFASDADFGPSLLFITDQSQERTDYQGIALGKQLGTSLFGYKADIVGFIGVQNFRERGFQPDSYGVTLYWKVYREWSPAWAPWQFPIRMGLGEGISYVSRIPISEQRDFEPRESAQTVHYLEWSLQVPVDGLLRAVGVDFPRQGKALWLGYNIFHRSTVFGLFADSGGGVNYPGIALEYVF